MNELEIPETARESWFKCGCDEREHTDILHLCDREGYTEEGVRLILAAELRRIADAYDVAHQEAGVENRVAVAAGRKPYAGITPLYRVRDGLRDRADELDGGL